jgi:glycosyltransferase involved in cell wall biosynthesis
MKICFFTENYYKGGLDTFIINLTNSWPTKSDELTLICNKTHPGLKTIKSKSPHLGISEYSFFFTSNFASGQKPMHLYLFLILRLIYRVFEYPVLLPWYIINLSRRFKNSDYDQLMVINGGYPASLLCRVAAISWRLAGKKSPVVFNFHNLVQANRWPVSMIENLIDRAVIKSSKSFITVSNACRMTLFKRTSFKDYKNAFNIHNGIEQPVSIGKMRVSELSDTSPYCLMLATYEPRKGHVYLLEAFKLVVSKFPDVKLRIYGYGTLNEKRKIVDLIYSLRMESNVILNEFVDNTSSLIKNAEILLIPSQAFESFGLTAIEAMSLGTPIVVTDVGGLPEVVENSGAGFVCSKDSPKDFAEAILTILASPLLSEQLSKRGLDTFMRNYTSTRMSAEYERHIKLIN